VVRRYRCLHRFAHDPLHRAAWSFWNGIAASHPHLQIWHELFDVPAGHYESVYANSSPSMLAATTVPVYSTKASSSSSTAWVPVAVDASSGSLRTSRGRLGRSDGADNDRYGQEPYKKLAGADVKMANVVVT
jgi:hypothetical protein